MLKTEKLRNLALARSFITLETVINIAGDGAAADGAPPEVIEEMKDQIWQDIYMVLGMALCVFRIYPGGQVRDTPDSDPRPMTMLEFLKTTVLVESFIDTMVSTGATLVDLINNFEQACDIAEQQIIELGYDCIQVKVVL